VSDDRSEPIDPRLVRALAHPLRIKILEILTERVASPNVLATELGMELSDVAYHTRALNRYGCLELVTTAQRRGATEHFYKASPDAFIGYRGWRKVPRTIRGAVTAASLQTFVDKAIGALEAGTIDARDDSTFTWMPVHLDDQGWEEVTKILAEATDRILAIQEKSNRRCGRKRVKRMISAVVALAHFETGASKAGEGQA
jgi:DNA-binding transcriptional ArsR family regulator